MTQIPLKKEAAQRTFVFAISATMAAGMCYLSDNLGYLAPFMATAAVLANAGGAIKKTLLATVVVYLISLVVGAIGALLLPATPPTIVLFCAAGFLLCVITSQQHPPALALLAVVFMRSPHWVSLIWLLCTALAVGLIAAIAHQGSIANLWQGKRHGPNQIG